MSTKERLSITVDAEFAAAAREAVREGRAKSISDWASTAFLRAIEEEERSRAMERFIAHVEAEDGPVTENDIEDMERYEAENTVHVRGRRR